ncbi:hypothetical protein A9Q91_00815 [Candidatus Gracilibacteria bacterium 28_42_T64]|nr:hypothetical protein A9Q91_00815 [Candidatus Gracilibacteria bacterium 28_42_T64]
MKKFLKLMILPLLIFSISGMSISHAGFLDDVFNDSSSAEIPYCKGGDKECGFLNGIEETKGIVNDTVFDRSASDYIQDIVAFLLGFVAIIAVIMIIYAGFNILTGAGDEEKVKKAKMTIVYVVIGIIVIYLAGPIFNLVVKILNGGAPIT